MNKNVITKFSHFYSVKRETQFFMHECSFFIFRCQMVILNTYKKKLNSSVLVKMKTLHFIVLITFVFIVLFMIWWLFWFYKSYQRLPTNQGLSTNMIHLEEVPATNCHASTLEAVYNSGITPSPPNSEDPPPSYDEIFP